MQVTAFLTPQEPDWRWRIVNYAGETIEESRYAAHGPPLWRMWREPNA